MTPRVFRSEILNDPVTLRQALADELPRNLNLARRLTARYRLKDRTAFAGWYLPLELANYRETAKKTEDGWVFQLSRFTMELSRTCRALADRPVASSPYFNGDTQDQKWLVSPPEMGRLFTRYLKGAGLSIIMLQDGVGVRHVDAEHVESYVLPYLVEMEKACKEASAPGRRTDSLAQCREHRGGHGANSSARLPLARATSPESSRSTSLTTLASRRSMSITSIISSARNPDQSRQ